VQREQEQASLPAVEPWLLKGVIAPDRAHWIGPDRAWFRKVTAAASALHDNFPHRSQQLLLFHCGSVFPRKPPRHRLCSTTFTSLPFPGWVFLHYPLPAIIHSDNGEQTTGPYKLTRSVFSPVACAFDPSIAFAGTYFGDNRLGCIGWGRKSGPAIIGSARSAGPRALASC